MLEIKVKAKNPNCIPQQAHEGEWFDLAAAEDMTLKTGDHKLIDLGVCIELPEGYEAIVAPRSSTFKRYGVLQTNSIGIIDHAYCGDEDWWRLSVYATRDAFISAGTRIAQFRIQKIQEPCKITLTSEMSNINRGGFGSSGV